MTHIVPAFAKAAVFGAAIALGLATLPSAAAASPHGGGGHFGGGHFGGGHFGGGGRHPGFRGHGYWRGSGYRYYYPGPYCDPLAFATGSCYPNYYYPYPY